MARQTIGRIRQLWRYPVKSMTGEALTEATVDRSGIIGDRKWAPMDSISGQLTNCRVFPRLLTCAAYYEQVPEPGYAVSHAAIVLPDGRTIHTSDAFVDTTISAIAGHPLSLQALQPPSDVEHYRIREQMSPKVMRKRMGLPPDYPIPDFSMYEPEMLQELQQFATPRGSYKDAYPLHILTSTALASLRSAAPGVDTDPRRFRPNILIETDDNTGYPEHDWQGFELFIGDAILQCGPKVVRCCMPSLPQHDLTAEPEIGAVLRDDVKMYFGAYVHVRQPGRIRAGDDVVLETSPNQPRMRPDIPAQPDTPPAGTDEPTPSVGQYNRMCVVGREQESEDTISLSLKAPHPVLRRFAPGQHLQFRLYPVHDAKPIIRSYSISNAPDKPPIDGDYQVTVKRIGTASDYLHDQVRVGDELEVHWPTGRYFALPQSDDPLVLISNGIGITPLVSMLESVVTKNPARTVFWVHATRDGHTHLFKEVVAVLAEQLSNFSFFVIYRQPNDTDLKGRDYHTTRYLEREDLAPLASMPNADVFLCGSPAFMDTAKALIATYDIPDRRIHIELFTSGNRAAASATQGAGTGPIRTVRFAASGVESQWVQGGPTLLEIAEDSGLSVDYGCRFGACEACSAGILEGTVAYAASDTVTRPGEILLCCAEPTSDIVLDL